MALVCGFGPAGRGWPSPSHDSRFNEPSDFVSSGALCDNGEGEAG